MRGGATPVLRTGWIIVILGFLYVPIISVILASLANTRYMRFPHKVWTLDAYRDAISSFTTWQLHTISLSIAVLVGLCLFIYFYARSARPQDE